MKRLFASAALLAAGSAFAAGDVDIVPYGYVTQVLREAAATRPAAGSRVSRDAPPAPERAQVDAEAREAARPGPRHVGEGDPLVAGPGGQRGRLPQAGARVAGGPGGGR